MATTKARRRHGIGWTSYVLGFCGYGKKDTESERTFSKILVVKRAAKKRQRLDDFRRNAE